MIGSCWIFDEFSMSAARVWSPSSQLAVLKYRIRLLGKRGELTVSILKGLLSLLVEGTRVRVCVELRISHLASAT